MAPQQIDDFAFLLIAATNRELPASIRLVREGVVAQTFETIDGTAEFLISVPPGDHPFLEILDDDRAAPSPAFPGRLTLHWLAVAGVSSYRIEEYVSSVWTTRDTVTANGQRSFTWLSRWLEDGQTHQFRITPIDAAGNAGTALTLSAKMVRHPDAPAVAYSHTTATTKLTIAAA